MRELITGVRVNQTNDVQLLAGAMVESEPHRNGTAEGEDPTMLSILVISL